MHAQVEKGVFEIEHATHAKQRRHVAPEHLVDDVLAQQALGLGDAFHLRCLGEAAAHQIFVKMPDIRTGDVRDAIEIRLRPIEQVAQRAELRQLRQRQVLDLKIFEERERSQADRVPAADTGFLSALHQRHGRAGKGDPPLFGEIHLVLDPGAPVADELRLVQEQVLRSFGTGFAFAPGLDHRLDAGELEDRMVEGGIKDVGRRHAAAEQRIGGLKHQGGLADLPRAGEQYGARRRWIGQPRLQFPEGGTAPLRQVGDGLFPPPWIELGEDGNEFFFGYLHVHKTNRTK